MNIDERLQKLTERHEALTQSVELLTSDLHQLQGVVKSLARVTGDVKNSHSQLERYITEIAEGTARLLHVAEAHEQRINRLEDLGSQQ